MPKCLSAVKFAYLRMTDPLKPWSWITWPWVALNCQNLAIKIILNLFGWNSLSIMSSLRTGSSSGGYKWRRVTPKHTGIDLVLKLLDIKWDVNQKVRVQTPFWIQYYTHSMKPTTLTKNMGIKQMYHTYVMVSAGIVSFRKNLETASHCQLRGDIYST